MSVQDDPNPATPPGRRPPEAWHELVHGRTPHHDRWWRAKPSIAADDDWLDTVIHAVIANGNSLEQPRFLLAQNDRHRVVAVACQAAWLSKTMNTDSGIPEEGRPLYTVVGWLVENTGRGWPPAPDHAAITAHARQWAAPIYEHWMGRVWQGPASAARNPELTEPSAAPWANDAEPAQANDRQDYLEPVRDLLLLPGAEAAHVWSAATRTTGPTVVTCGWTLDRKVPRRLPMYACVDDVNVPRTITLATAGSPAQSSTRFEQPQRPLPEPEAVAGEWNFPREDFREHESANFASRFAKRLGGGVKRRADRLLDEFDPHRSPPPPAPPAPPVPPPVPPPPARREPRDGPLTKQRRLSPPDRED